MPATLYKCESCSYRYLNWPGQGIRCPKCQSKQREEQRVFEDQEAISKYIEAVENWKAGQVGNR